MKLFDDPKDAEAAPAPKPKRAKKAKTDADPAIQRLFDVYHRQFLRRWNACAGHRVLGCRRCSEEGWLPFDPANVVKPFYEGGRDAKSFKALKDAWGEDVVARLIGDFFRSTDPQIMRSDYKVKIFAYHAQRLRLVQHAGARDARTAENIDAAHRAMQKNR